MKMFKRIVAVCTVLVACFGAFAYDADVDLYNAIKIGSLPKIQTALRNGANPNQCFANIPKGTSLFTWAVEISSVEVIETLLVDSHVPVIIDGDKDFYPAIFSALKSKDKRKFVPLIRHGANVNIDYYGTTPLMYAVDLGLSKSIEYFAAACKEESVKLEVNYKNEEHRTALYYAINSDDNNEDCVLALLSIGASTENIDSKTGKTALGLAFEKMQQGKSVYSVIKALIKNGADITNIDEDGNNALCVALVENLDSRVVEWILDKYKGDFRKLKYKSSGRFKNKTALEIMRMMHTEDEYEDIFEQYM